MTLAQLYYALAPEEEERRGLPIAPHGRRLTGLAALMAGKGG